MKNLILWSENVTKKPLIIEGARQVGKTFIIREFAKTQYGDNVIELNFITKKSETAIFSGDISYDALLTKIKIFYSSIDYTKKVLLFIDEIQAYAEAITALKSFAGQTTFDVIASGSLLGVHYNQVSSFPVGYVERMTLYPLDFPEFVSAFGESDLLAVVAKSYANKTKVEEVYHERMLRLFIKYIVIGGMPEVVTTYLQTRDFNAVLKMQQDIINDYKDDIAKYATVSEKIRAREVFDSLPFQLAKENKKFQYASVRKGARSSDYLNSIKWLIDAGIVYQANLLTNLEIPLVTYRQPDHFKIYLMDTGLLVALLGKDAQRLLLTNELGIAKGAIYENIIATILKVNHHDLYYYERSSGLELDFIIVKDTKITALEVKSGENTKAKSLQRVLSENIIDQGIKLTRGNYSKHGATTTLPLYFSMFL